MSTTPREPAAVRTKSVWPMFVLGVGMIALFWGGTEIIRSWIPSGSNEEAVRSELRMENLRVLREQNREELNSFAWVDKAKGVVRIPIERAMELEVAALNNAGEPRPTYPTDPAVAAAEAEAAAAAAAPEPTPATTDPAPPTSTEAGADAPAPESAPAETPAP